MKSQRPDIPKLKIISIGGFIDDWHIDKYWNFDGSSHPNSVGTYYTEDWKLYGGYTVEELKVISEDAKSS